MTDEVFEQDLLSAEADMFARFIEGKLSPELTREMETFLETSPEARALAEFATDALAEQDTAAEADWPGRLHAVTGNVYDYKAWLPSPLLDSLEERRGEATADPDSRRHIVDQFELEKGHFSLFWQGNELFVELITTNPLWWRAVAEAWLLTPSTDDRSNTVVNANVSLELASDANGRYLCTSAIPIRGELTEESRLYVLVPHSPPNLDDPEVIRASGKLRPGNIEVSDGILRQLRESLAEIARGNAPNVSSEKPAGYRRVAIHANGLACALFWDNVDRKMNLYAEITDPALVGKRFEFAVMAGPEQTMIGNTSHVFTEALVPMETTFELTEEFSRGGTDISLHVANVSASE